MSRKRKPIYKAREELALTHPTSGERTGTLAKDVFLLVTKEEELPMEMHIERNRRIIRRQLTNILTGATYSFVCFHDNLEKPLALLEDLTEEDEQNLMLFYDYDVYEEDPIEVLNEIRRVLDTHWVADSEL